MNSKDYIKMQNFISTVSSIYVRKGMLLITDEAPRTSDFISTLFYFGDIEEDLRKHVILYLTGQKTDETEKAQNAVVSLLNTNLQEKGRNTPSLEDSIAMVELYKSILRHLYLDLTSHENQLNYVKHIAESLTDENKERLIAYLTAESLSTVFFSDKSEGVFSLMSSSVDTESKAHIDSCGMMVKDNLSLCIDSIKMLSDLLYANADMAEKSRIAKNNMNEDAFFYEEILAMEDALSNLKERALLYTKYNNMPPNLDFLDGIISAIGEIKSSVPKENEEQQRYNSHFLG